MTYWRYLIIVIVTFAVGVVAVHTLYTQNEQTNQPTSCQLPNFGDKYVLCYIGTNRNPEYCLNYPSGATGPCTYTKPSDYDY